MTFEDRRAHSPEVSFAKYVRLFSLFDGHDKMSSRRQLLTYVLMLKAKAYAFVISFLFRWPSAPLLSETAVCVSVIEKLLPCSDVLQTVAFSKMLRTDSKYLNGHLYKINCTLSPLCECRAEIQTVSN